MATLTKEDELYPNYRSFMTYVLLSFTAVLFFIFNNVFDNILINILLTVIISYPLSILLSKEIVILKVMDVSKKIKLNLGLLYVTYSIIFIIVLWTLG